MPHPAALSERRQRFAFTRNRVHYEPQSSIAEDFECSQSTISRAVRRVAAERAAERAAREATR